MSHVLIEIGREHMVRTRSTIDILPLLLISACFFIATGCNQNSNTVGEKNNAAIGNDSVGKFDIGG